MFDINVIPILKDNHLWLLSKGEQAWVIDPGDHEPILAYLRENNLTLQGILVTHHHWDHIDGIKPLLQSLGNTAIPIWGPSHRNHNLVTHAVSPGQVIDVLGEPATVMMTPGHTADHVCYWFRERADLFCGDTLFNCGCGRLFDSTAECLHASLQKIQQLDEQTLLHCSHEYTLANLNFAAELLNDHEGFEHYRKTMTNKVAAGQITTAFRLQEQKMFNPFLMTHLPKVQQAISQYFGRAFSNEQEYFGALRRWKDQF